MPGYLDDIFGLPQEEDDVDALMAEGAQRYPSVYGSDAEPMNMEATDLRPEPVRIDLGNGSFITKDPREPLDTANFGDMTPRPEPIRRDLGNGSFAMVSPSGLAGPPASAAPRGPAGPPADVAGSAKPKRPVSSAVPSAPQDKGDAVPPGTKVYSSKGVTVEGGAPVTAGGAEGAEGGWNGEFYAPGEKGSQWNEFLEDPSTAPDKRRDPLSQSAIQDDERSYANSPVPTEMSERELDAREWERQQRMSPQERAADMALREQKREKMALDQMATQAATQRHEAEQNLTALTLAQQQTAAEREAIKNRPGWLESRSTGQKIALYAGSVFSGMLAAFQGSSKNAVIESMHQAIEQDAEERAQELAANSAEMADAQEMFKFKELARIRSYEEAKQLILINAQKYDPRGSKVAGALAAVQDVDARIAQAEQKVLEYNWKKKHEELKIASDERQTRARLEQDERESRRQAGVQYAQIRSNEKLAADSAKSMKDQADLENTKARTANVQLETQDRINQVTGGPGGNPYAFGDIQGNPYRNKDGSVFAVKDDTRRKDIDNVNSAAKQVRRMADLVKILREKDGGASAAVGSPEYQELRSLAAQTDFETYKAFGLGAPSAGDQQMATAARGGKDITSFIYSPEAGFDTYANGLEAKLNTKMRDAGYTGPDVKLPRWRTPTAEDEALERSRHYSPGAFPPGSKYRQAAEEAAAEKAAEEAPPDYAPVYDDSEDPWEKARRGDE